MIVPKHQTFLHNQRLGLVQPRNNTPWHPELFEHLFNTRQFRDRVHADGTGVKVRHTSPDKLSSITVRFPSSEGEQKRVAFRLSEIKNATVTLENVQVAKLAALAELKQSLLRKAFAGELTSAVQPRSHVVASQYLETSSPEFSAHILAFAYSLHALGNRDKTFGRVKAQKTLHLVESIGGIDLGRMPIKDAAGPNDSAHMRRAESWASENAYFQFDARHKGGYDFKKLKDFNKLLAGSHAKLGLHKPKIEHIIELLLPMDSQEAEVFATVHAAWNNLVADGVEVNEQAILRESRENWKSSKLNIPEQKFCAAIQFIRSNNLIPDGTAKPVRGQEFLF